MPLGSERVWVFFIHRFNGAYCIYIYIYSIYTTGDVNTEVSRSSVSTWGLLNSMNADEGFSSRSKQLQHFFILKTSSCLRMSLFTHLWLQWLKEPWQLPPSQDVELFKWIYEKKNGLNVYLEPPQPPVFHQIILLMNTEGEAGKKYSCFIFNEGTCIPGQDGQSVFLLTPVLHDIPDTRRRSFHDPAHRGGGRAVYPHTRVSLWKIGKILHKFFSERRDEEDRSQSRAVKYVATSEWKREYDDDKKEKYYIFSSLCLSECLPFRTGAQRKAKPPVSGRQLHPQAFRGKTEYSTRRLEFWRLWV